MQGNSIAEALALGRAKNNRKQKGILTMKTLKMLWVLALVGVLLVVAASGAFAASNAGDAALMGGLFSGCMVFILAMIALNIAILVWLAKDVKVRGGDNPVVWVIATLLFGPIALIVYVLARNKGEIGICENCGNKKLVSLVKCPHCGADRAAGKKAE